MSVAKDFKASALKLFISGQEHPLAQVHVHLATIEVILGHGAHVGTHFKPDELTELIGSLQMAKEKMAEGERTMQ